MTKAWLADFNWDQLVSINRSLCEARKVEPELNVQFEKAKKLWDKKHTKSMTLDAALDLCRRANDVRPFVFNCCSTFSKLATDMVEDWAEQLTSVDAHLLRSSNTNYVDGNIGRKELKGIIRYLESRPREKNVPELVNDALETKSALHEEMLK